MKDVSLKKNGEYLLKVRDIVFKYYPIPRLEYYCDFLEAPEKRGRFNVFYSPTQAGIKKAEEHRNEHISKVLKVKAFMKNYKRHYYIEPV